MLDTWIVTGGLIGGIVSEGLCTLCAVRAARDACAVKPCQNGGTCVPVEQIVDPEGYICKCLDEFVGEHCQTGYYHLIDFMTEINFIANSSICYYRFLATKLLDFVFFRLLFIIF